MAILFILGLIVAGGYVLGIIGFFRAISAHAELRALRRALTELGARGIAPAEPVSVPAPIAPTLPVATEETTERPSLPAPEPAPAESPPAMPAKPARDLETLLTARWGVWLGSAALLFAGIFLVRYAVEQELLGPGARCGMAALLGVGLLAAAEWLFRHEAPAVPGPFHADQAPAGLAAGGTAVLFGAAYGAGPFYDLLPPLLAFAAMAAASFTGLAAALRYGPLTAATGIAGAFITPALVATEDPSLPGLFAYLLVVSAAAWWVVRYTAWTWLGWATTIAGAIWVCIAAFDGERDTWAAAAFVPASAALALFLLPAAALGHPIGLRLAWVPFAVIGTAGLVLESLISGAAPRLALFLLSPIAVWRGFTEPRLDRLPWIAALFGLLTLLLWALPAWNPTGEIITVEGIVEAFLPGAWAPDVIRPLIAAAAAFATFHAAVGLWLERRAPRPLHWAALTGAVPVVTLAVAYAQIARFQTGIVWAAVALALTALLTATASRAAAESARRRAGVHAAGAVAALALGCAMLLHDHWLTLAVALFLPALAWIEARADLSALRHVALAVAALVLIRLVLNWYVLDYAFGRVPVANGLIAAYAAPAVSFAVAAFMFRRRADDLVVATLEAGAVTLASIFVALEIRHGFGEGRLLNLFSFNEIALHLLTLSVQATVYLHLSQRTGRPILEWAWHILGSASLLAGGLLLVFNPAFTGARVSVLTLLAAYLIPAALATAARPHVARLEWRRALSFFALIAGFAWITLQVRQLFHPEHMSVIYGDIDDAELWAWSGAWLVYGIALMFQGIRTEQRAPRLAALGVVGLVCIKVFLIDMSGLTGLWRVLSFLGLGLGLIGLGVVHRRFVLPMKRGPDEPPAPEASR
ncbi:MAG: DUF2339 domain-containing protein [Acetobacteraceae bacterium]|nr:DUF2339 domain-containing protein [Acetobacteraceae bacterium]